MDATVARQWIQRWDRQQEVSLPEREDRFTALIDAVQEAAGSADPLVLDIGCGPGSLGIRLLERLPDATVIGIDTDPVTLALGRAAYGDRITFTSIDLRDPGWPSRLPVDRPADAAVSTTALHWLTEDALRAFYRTLAGVLRPGGVFLNGDHLREDPGTAPTLARLGQALNELEDRRRFPGGHGESWTGWWDAVTADPGLAALAAERATLNVGADHGSSGAILLPVHMDALRAAGFAEVGTLWQRGASRLLCAIRLAGGVDIQPFRPGPRPNPRNTGSLSRLAFGRRMIVMAAEIEIIDAQVHLNQLGADWRTASIDSVIATGIQAMDAVGVDRVLIGEAHGFDSQFRPLGKELPNGAVRTAFPFSERAVELHPARFAYHVVVDFRDPELDRLTAGVQTRPGANSMRIVPVPQTGAVDSLEHGEFNALFAAAERHQVPVFAWVPGRAHLSLPYIQRFPELQFIVDHCGVGVAPLRRGELPVTMESSLTKLRDDRLAQLERVCDMAQYPNVALKWCHAPGLLSEEDYPYRDVMPLLRQAIDAFGVERIMWASDYTVARDQNGNSWAQCLYYLLDSDQLSRTEKEWLLGGSVRRVLNWAD